MYSVQVTPLDTPSMYTPPLTYHLNANNDVLKHTYTEFENSNTVLQERINELEQQLEHQYHELTTMEQQGTEKMALLTSQVDAANRQIQSVRTRAAMDAAMVVSKHDDEIALLRSEIDHYRSHAESNGEQAEYAKQLQSELDEMRSQQDADKAAWTAEREKLTRQVEIAQQATEEVHRELNDVRASWCEKDKAWNVEQEIHTTKLADSTSQLQGLMKDVEELQSRHKVAQETHAQAIQNLQEKLTTLQTQHDEKDRIITTSTNEMNDLRHALAETKDKLSANEEKFSVAEEEQQRLLVLENSKAQIAAAEMRLTFSEERRKLKEEMVNPTPPLPPFSAFDALCYPPLCLCPTRTYSSSPPSSFLSHLVESSIW